MSTPGRDTLANGKAERRSRQCEEWAEEGENEPNISQAELFWGVAFCKTGHYLGQAKIREE